jgi:DNA-binding FadR family transcriptional regulator
MKANRRNLRKAANADMAFHTALAKASCNNLLLSFLLQIRNLLRSWIESVLLIPGRYDNAIEAHSSILRAVAEHDIEGARIELRKHLDSVADALTSKVLPVVSSKEISVERATKSGETGKLSGK